MQKQTNDCSETVLLRVNEVAKMLKLGRSKVYEMTKMGELPVVKIGTAVRIPREELMKWLAQHTSKAA